MGLSWLPELLPKRLLYAEPLGGNWIDGTQLRLEPGQTVIPHGPDRDLGPASR
jgi:hypothetical protein